MFGSRFDWWSGVSRLRRHRRQAGRGYPWRLPLLA
jgi:hypothetical protein